MARLGRLRRSVRRNVRRTLELILLSVSMVVGLFIVGSCAGVGAQPLASAELSGFGAVAGVLFALVVVGTVFLFTTMSRDLRLLRDRYEGDDHSDTSRTSPDTRAPRSPDADV